MKKLLVSLAAAVLAAALFGVSASAAEPQTKDEEIQEMSHEVVTVLSQQIHSRENLVGVAKDLSAARALREAGWNVEVENPQAKRNAAVQGVDQATYDLACSDLDGASPAEKKAIRAAREEIIYRADWSAEDSVICYAMDPETKTVTFPPRFQDMFPGWEVPGTYDNNGPATEAASAVPGPAVAKAASQVLDGAAAAKNAFVILFNNSVSLRNPSTTTITPAFYNAPTASGLNAFTAYANLLTSSANYNLGFTKSSGGSFGYWGGLGVNQVRGIMNIPYAEKYVGVRVSTNSTPGTAWMVVTRENTGS